MKRWAILAIGLMLLASGIDAEEPPTEDELQPETVQDDLGAGREGSRYG